MKTETAPTETPTRVHYTRDDGLDGQEPIDWMTERGPVVIVTEPYLPDRGMQTRRVRVHAILGGWSSSEEVHDYETAGATDAAIERARALLRRVAGEYLPAYHDGVEHMRAHPGADIYALTWGGAMSDRGYSTELQRLGWEAGLSAERYRDADRLDQVGP